MPHSALPFALFQKRNSPAARFNSYLCARALGRVVNC